MTTAVQLSELPALAGTTLGVSDWVPITQEMIDRFADATGDHQWIHVDPERARRESPFGAPVAHGFLTLSLLPALMQSAMQMPGVKIGVNYGLNRVRFTAPVPVGSRLRARMKLLATEPVAPNGFQSTWQVTVEREGSDKPVCVAESVSRAFA